MATQVQDDPQTAMPADSRPDRDVVLFDGHCRFCQAQMRQLRWWDRGGRLDYLSLHEPEVARQWPDLPCDRLLQEMCVIDRQGNRHWGAAAVRYLSRRLPTLWWLAPIMHVPGSMIVWRPLYRFIARHRYRLWGRAAECDDGTCEVHGR